MSGYDVDELLDGQMVRSSTFVFLLVAALALVSDGFDIAAIGFVAPELVRAWNLPRAAMVPVLSAGLWGLLVGGPLLGFLGDRFGRKRAVVAGLAWAGVLTLLCMEASSLRELVVLRFLAGAGLGGVISNVIALTAEAAPKRLRGRFIILVSLGVPAGFALPGLVGAALVPRFGWPSLFLAGGVLPLAAALTVALVVPESIKFLAHRGGRDEAVRRIARRIRPDLLIEPGARITLARNIPAAASGSFRKLFAGRLALATPLLWVAVAANQMVNFFAITWLPTLLQSAGSSTVQASLFASAFAISGIVGALTLTMVIDRFGAVPNIVLFVAGVPLVAAMGVAGLPPWLSVAVIAAAGFCVTGNNAGANTTMGTIYPTAIRAAGIGWAQGVGRVGSLVAPLVGGILLESEIPVTEALFAPALFLAVGAVAWTGLAAICIRRFGGVRLREFALTEAG